MSRTLSHRAFRKNRREFQQIFRQPQLFPAQPQIPSECSLFQFDAPSDGKQNGLHAGQLKSYIQLCLALSQMAKTVRTASSKPQQNENPKYAMRTWLLRLGFIGDEFKTARELFTKRLDGDAAFREGRRPEIPESADGGLSVVEGNFGKEL